MEGEDEEEEGGRRKMKEKGAEEKSNNPNLKGEESSLAEYQALAALVGRIPCLLASRSCELDPLQSMTICAVAIPKRFLMNLEKSGLGSKRVCRSFFDDNLLNHYCQKLRTNFLPIWHKQI